MPLECFKFFQSKPSEPKVDVNTALLAHQTSRAPAATTDEIPEAPKRITQIPIRKVLVLLLYLSADAVNGGFGPSMAIVNFAEAFPAVTAQFFLPASILSLGLTYFFSRIRTNSVIKDDDGVKSFTSVDILIDFFNFFNFNLSLGAAIGSAILGPEKSKDVSITDVLLPLTLVAAGLAAIYSKIAWKKHHDALENKWLNRLFEFFQVMQVVGAVTNLLQTILNSFIDRNTWRGLAATFIPALVLGVAGRYWRDNYPVFYKTLVDIVPMVIYIMQSIKLLTHLPYLLSAAPAITTGFVLLLAVAATLRVFKALWNAEMPQQHVEAVLDNPTVVPGRHLTENDGGKPSVDDEDLSLDTANSNVYFGCCFNRS